MPLTPDIVFDCCVLSNFALTGSLALLKTMYTGAACVTPSVSSENLRGIQGGYEGLAAIRDVLREGWILEISLKTPDIRATGKAMTLSGKVVNISCRARRGLNVVTFHPSTSSGQTVTPDLNGI